MTNAIVTPLTQALAEGKLTRAELKELMQRSNGPGLVHLALWLLLLATTTTLVVLAWNSWLIWPAMFVQGVVLVHHFSLQHECVHYTVFRTRWLNDLVGQVCGYIILLPHRFFRYEHCDHHTYTQVTGQDPEQVPMPETIWQYLLYLSALPYWKTKFTEVFRHAMGRLSETEKGFIPKVEHAAVYRDARMMLGFYAAVILGMALTGWWGLIWLWFIPLLLGEPVMRFIRMTEHVGRPTVPQMHENTRTSLVSLPLRFLCWNMNYHAEHHYVASVPFHRLPVLHEKLRDHIFVEKGGYLGAHRDILRQIFARQA
ncbi:fatty acid desaturase family protein [Alterinioella nitratireducens]|uniref:fatty acid desaturase family protein n=1 Tax=Alterinioella nitratireducens TaxID=2735915 RepID=UPI001556916D|nr:fatty acid desaturase family protein [Alterinioella nitratireducens]NPD17872.1 fatty acid desaturase family protein [Alterinioella nitratireducens]